MTTSATGGYLQGTGGPAEDDALVDIVQAAIVGITGIDAKLVRPRWQLQPLPVPEPLTSWAAVGIADSDPDVNGAVLYDADDNTATSVRNEQITFLVSFYGPCAGKNAALLRDGVGIAQNREALNAAGLALVSVGKALRTGELVKNQWLPRLDVPIILRRQAERSYAIESLQAADASASTGDLTSTVEITTT